MVVLTYQRFCLCFKVYSVFQQDKLYKRGIGSLNQLGVLVEGGCVVSSSFRDFARELLDAGVLVVRDNLIFLDEDALDVLIQEGNFRDLWACLDEYYSDRVSLI